MPPQPTIPTRIRGVYAISSAVSRGGGDVRSRSSADRGGTGVPPLGGFLGPGRELEREGDDVDIGVAIPTVSSIGAGALLTFLAAGASVVAPRTFDMRDPKGVSGLSLRIDSALEPVHGSAVGVSGSVVFDPEKPELSKGTVSIAAKEVRLGSQGLTEAMHEDWCLDVAKHPSIDFTVKRVYDVKADGPGRWTVKVDGDFKLKDVTKPLTVTATVTHLKDSIKARGGMEGKDGDLLQIRSRFSFNRLDFGVAPDLNPKVIGPVVEVDLSFVGVSPN